MTEEPTGEQRSIDGWLKRGQATLDEYDAFFTRAFPPLVRWLRMQGASLPEAEDAAQETLIALFREWERVAPKARMAWCRKAAYRVLGKHNQKNNNNARREVVFTATQLTPPTPELLDLTRPGWCTEHEELLKLIREMPPARRAVAACLMDGLDRDQIAEILDIARGTVRSHIRYIRDTPGIRAILERIKSHSTEGGHK